MPKPLSPLEIITRTVRLSEHETLVDQYTVAINNLLITNLFNVKARGAESAITVPLPDATQQVVLELVYQFRKAGWNVEYFDGSTSCPFIRVGIKQKI
jgi:hypothetical protein